VLQIRVHFEAVVHGIFRLHTHTHRHTTVEHVGVWGRTSVPHHYDLAYTCTLAVVLHEGLRADWICGGTRILHKLKLTVMPHTGLKAN
jgi:hypothetical protein